MPRPSEARTSEEIFADIVRALNSFGKSGDESLGSLTIKISQLKQVKTDISKLIRAIEKKRDFDILKNTEEKKISIRRKVE